MGNTNDSISLSIQTYSDGVLADPTSLSCLVTAPDNTTQTFSYSANTIVRYDVGQYTTNPFPTTQSGAWRFEWTCVGADGNETSGSFSVDPAPVDVQVHVEDSLAASMSGVQVEIFKSDLKTLLYAGSTNVNGQIYTSLLPGTYVVYVKKNLTAFSSYGVAWNVPGDGTTLTIQGTVLAFQPPVLSSLKCTLYGYIFGADGAPVRSTVIVDVFKKQTIAGGGGTSVTQQTQTANIISRKHELKSSNSDGSWSFDVVQGAFVRVYYPETNFTKVFQIPMGATSLNIIDAFATLKEADVGIVLDSPYYVGF